MKHKRTKATDISNKTRQIVRERDEDMCIMCLAEGEKQRGVHIAHYINRSQGGLGIPENLVLLCVRHHMEEDNGKDGRYIHEYMKNYLQGYYGKSWNEEKLFYNKWGN